MTIVGNPKKLANDIAQGYHPITPSTLRQYDQTDLNVLLFNLNIMLRDVRSKPALPHDMEALRDRNLRMTRLNQAIGIIQTYRATRGSKG